MTTLEKIEMACRLQGIKPSALTFYMEFRKMFKPTDTQLHYTGDHPTTNKRIKIQIDINELKAHALDELMQFQFTVKEVYELKSIFGIGEVSSKSHKVKRKLFTLLDMITEREPK